MRNKPKRQAKKLAKALSKYGHSGFTDGFTGFDVVITAPKRKKDGWYRTNLKKEGFITKTTSLS